MSNHSSRAHALLSPSSAARWIACPPSARLEATKVDKDTLFAKEGTIAHEVAEIIASSMLDDTSLDNASSLLSSKLEACAKYDFDFPDMGNCAKGYAEYISEKLKPKDCVLLEEKLDFTEYIPEGFGTGDCIILNSDKLTIIDYKYGKNIMVEAKDNPQLMIYALGAILRYELVYGFKEIEMCIYQPRMNHISEHCVSTTELKTWAENVLKPAAALAYEGGGTAVPGKHCQFCKMAGKCEALYKATMDTVAQDFDGSSSYIEMTPKRTADALNSLPLVELWVRRTKEQSLDDALAGVKIPGYKLVEGVSRRRYKDENAIRSTLVSEGWELDKINKPEELLGITALKKVVGSTVFNEIVDPMLIKPQGKPTLVLRSDKRPELSVLNDFKEEK